VTAETQATPKHQRRRRASTGGHALKLDAPERKGFVRRWVNDEPGRVQEAHELGYDFAEDKAAEGVSRTDGQGSRISRIVGRDAQGGIKYAYLMETPASEYAKGVIEKEERLAPFEEAINRGGDTTGKVGNAYQPGRSTINHSG
jgi:hypothetical protein